MGQPKIFVLDTNVILHDHKAIRHFQDNNLVIPIAVVEELDKFKKGNDSLAFNARGFMRDIDRITEGKSFGKEGLPIGPRLGRIKVEPNHPFSGDYVDMFKDDIPDHRILATAMWVRDHNPGTFVALVTKDVNLRLKAKAAGMAVQDYLTDKVEEARIENSQREVQVFTLSSDKMQALLYGPDNALEWKSVCSSRPAPNQFFRFKWENNNEETACARYDAVKDRIVLIKMKEAYGIRPRNDEQMMALDALTNSRIDLVSLTGGAGTGKTLLALAAALEQEREYEQIILSRPTVVLGSQDIGFLPGDQKTKMGPFLQPLMDNLNVIIGQFKPNSREALRIESMLAQEKLIIEPLAYISGRSLGKCYFNID